MLICLLALMMDPFIAETGVYQPLRPGEVLVRPDGGLYVVVFEEAQIEAYDAQGKHERTIGRKGKGPGEFTYPRNVFLQDGILYAEDILAQQVSLFDARGSFIKRIRTPYRWMNMVKVRGGWIYANWGIFSKPEQATLYFAKDDFSEPQALTTLKDEIIWEGVISMSGDDGKVTGVFSPVDQAPILTASADGATAYLSDITRFKIYSFSGTDGATGPTIERDSKMIPFDEAWGKERYEARTEGRQGKFEAKFPDYFPPFRAMTISHDGLLVVNRWRGRPDGQNWVVAFDQNGRDVAKPPTWDEARRIVGVHQGHAYITIYQQEAEESGLARVPLAEAAAFIAKNPIVYDGPRGYSINFSSD